MERVVKTIRFPADILREMRPHMEETKLNFTGFVIEAIKHYMRALKFQKGVNASFGGWSEHNHPELDGEEGIEKYVRDMREGRKF